MADPEYVGFWARFSAQIIDIFIMSIISAIVGGLAAFIPLAGGTLALIATLAFLYKNVKGQTPGRRMLKMRVVDRHGQDIGFWRGLLRETLGKFVSVMFFGLGIIWIAFDGRKQGWHDKIASTFVIKQAQDQFKINPTAVSISSDRGPVPVEISDTNGARWYIYPEDGGTGRIIADPGKGDGDGTVYFSRNDWDNTLTHSTQVFYVAVSGKGRRAINVKVTK